MDKLNVVKVGGTIINDKILLGQFLSAFSSISGKKILVHGGGKKATEISSALDIDTRMIDGRRITDASNLEVVVMVYAGLINKSIVARLQANGLQSLGISGADWAIIKSHKRKVFKIDYGLVGDIDYVDDHKLQKLIALGITPVICPITYEASGQLLNTNADTIAAKIAMAMHQHYDVTLKYCFEYPGVIKDINHDKTTIPRLSSTLYSKLKSDGKIHSGMLPKIDNAFSVLNTGVERVAICGIDNLISEKELTWIG